MGNDLKHFIINATDKIDEKLWNKLTKGTLTRQFVLDYFRDSESIDDKTFKLINDSFFKNNDIATFEDLQNYIEHTPEYYASRLIAKKFGYYDKLSSIMDPNFAVNLINILQKDKAAERDYINIKNRYYKVKMKDNKEKALDISEKYLRTLWMRIFDGSVDTASAVAFIAKDIARRDLQVTGKLRTVSTDEEVGDGITRADRIAAQEKQITDDAWNQLDYAEDVDKMIDEIGMVFLKGYAKELIAKGETGSKALTESKDAVKKLKSKLSQLSNEQIRREYKKSVESINEEDIHRWFNMTIVAETLGMDSNNLNKEQRDEVEKIVEGAVTIRNSNAVVNNMNSLIRTIKSHLSPKDKERFLEENSDLFTSKLKLKENVYKDKDANGRYTYKEVKYLLGIEDRLRGLATDARQGAYRSKEAKRYKELYEQKLAQLNELMRKLKSGEIAPGGPSVTIEVENKIVTLSTTKEMPSVLQSMLKKQFKSTAPSLTQFVTEKEEVHMKLSAKEFIENNADYLYGLTQSQVNEIVDYFENTFPLLGSENERQYVATQICVSAFLLEGYKKKLYDWTLTDEQVKILESKLASTVSESAAVLPIWRDVMQKLNPEKIIASAFARKTGVEYDGMEADIERLINANEVGNIDLIMKARQDMLEHARDKFKGRPKTKMDKILDLQRLMMLSGPGTWVRNTTSNIVMTGTDMAASSIGKGVTNILSSLFPKKMKNRENQYKIIGTKVTSEVQTFVNNEVIKTGLLSIIRDGFNKYDFRKSKKQDVEVTITDLIVSSIENELFQTNQFKFKPLRKMQEFIYKAMSDDKFINKRALVYFAKILTESKTNLEHGMSKDVLNKLAEAYTLAAIEFMHKHNVINDIEAKLREKNSGAYFVWKQIAPFAASSWNWFAEGLNYTPVGLIKSIVNFAKMEKTIESLEARRAKGEMVYSSKFAQYMITKNIGKGVIGSVGLVLGLLLAASGKAGLDEEDDKYKLYVGNVKVDITDLFGTQGIMMGIAMGSKNDNLADMITNTLDLMFQDSLYTTFWDVFRYSQGFSDFALYLPTNFLQMMVPNFLKTFSSLVSKYKVKYSKGILGKVEQLAVQAVPFLSYAMPHYYDPYTGEKQVKYKMWWLTNTINKLSPVDISNYNVSDIEKEAISLGVKKSSLIGSYKVNDVDVKLSASDIEKVNKFYGKLNNKDLTELMNSNKTYKVQKEDGTYAELPYNKMTDKQKATVINRIMENNSSISKIYILTSNNKYSYYASDEEYSKLKKLGIDVKKANSKNKGFVKN